MDDQEKQPNYRVLLIIGIISMAVAIVWFLALQTGNQTAESEPRASASYALDASEPANSSTTEAAPAPASNTAEASPAEPSASETRAAFPEPSASESRAASPKPSASPSASEASMRTDLVAFANNIFSLSESEDDALDGMRVLTITEAGEPLELQRILWQFDLADGDEVIATWNGRELSDHDVVGTGTILELTGPNGLVSDRAVVVVPGDVTGSGQLDDGQLAILTEALENPDLLTGAYLLAGDMDGSGEIDIADLRLLGQAID